MAESKRKLSGAAKAAADRKATRSSSSSSRSRGGRYTAPLVARAFGGAVTFGGKTAGAVADAISRIDGLGDMHPDQAGREVQRAITQATRGDEAGRGALVSIDTCIAAVSYMHAELGFEGEQVGGPDDQVPAQPQGGAAGDGGTAAAAGAASSGAGATAG